MESLEKQGEIKNEAITEQVGAGEENYLEETDKKRLEIIENIKEPIGKILEQLNSDVRDGNYELIIGDDASGRIPTLIIREVMSLVNKKNNKPNPKTIFIAKPRIDYRPEESSEKFQERTKDIEKNIRNHVRKILETFIKSHGYKPKKILVVTEGIATGNTLQPLIKSLKTLGVEFNIATLSIGMNRDYLNQEWGTTIAAGSDDRGLYGGGFLI